MDELTRSLLLKLRKGATAGFELKQWKTVLEALGLRFEITKKVRNSVVQVTVSSGAQQLVIDKEQRYRCITFYDLSRWLKSVGVDTVARASELLGLDSPNEEKRLKELYVRDLTNTGTCPVCNGNFKRATDGGLVHHGYQRPGDGYIYGDCFAVGYQPWEISSEGASAYVTDVLETNLADERRYLERLVTGKIDRFIINEQRRIGTSFRTEKVAVTVIQAEQPERFEKLLKTQIEATGNRARFIEEQIVLFNERIAAWKPDVLPEIKYAGKFRGS